MCFLDLHSSNYTASCNLLIKLFLLQVWQKYFNKDKYLLTITCANHFSKALKEEAEWLLLKIKGREDMQMLSTAKKPCHDITKELNIIMIFAEFWGKVIWICTWMYLLKSKHTCYICMSNKTHTKCHVKKNTQKNELIRKLQPFIRDMVKHELRVESLKTQVEIQRCEFKCTS